MKKNLKWIGMILLVVLAVVFVGCKKPHRVALVAHMGYWDCEAGGGMHNWHGDCWQGLTCHFFQE